MGPAKRGALNVPVIPPTAFPSVIEHLAQSQCAEQARVAVEKPFGREALLNTVVLLGG